VVVVESPHRLRVRARARCRATDAPPTSKLESPTPSHRPRGQNHRRLSERGRAKLFCGRHHVHLVDRSPGRRGKFPATFSQQSKRIQDRRGNARRACDSQSSGFVWRQVPVEEQAQAQPEHHLPCSSVRETGRKAHVAHAPLPLPQATGTGRPRNASLFRAGRGRIASGQATTL
jgi:hypothetical protein